MHVMRAIEPNLRFGRTIKDYLSSSTSVPQCELQNTEESNKCVRIASRKQIGDALIKFQDKQKTLDVNI